MADAGAFVRPPLITGDKSIAQVTQDVSAPMERRPGLLWWVAFLISVALLALGALAIGYQIATGVGTGA